MAHSRAMRAVCKAAGWDYCADHDRPRSHGPESCDSRHKSTPMHTMECIYADPMIHPDCICGATPSARKPI